MSRVTQWQTQVRSPQHWVWAAERLHSAAHLLWQSSVAERRRLRSRGAEPTPDSDALIEGAFVALALAGFSLENLVKAVLIQKDPSLVGASRLDRSLTSGHPLPALFVRACPLEPHEELSFVERAATFLVWSGRYPWPISDQPVPLGARMSLSSDPQVFNRLYRRLRALLKVGV